MPKTAVYLEIGSKRTFAAAVDWPGWCRSGRDETTALEALVEYGPRYSGVVGGTAGFKPPDKPDELEVVERLAGNATTDFGAPGVIPDLDRVTFSHEELERLLELFQGCWRAFERARTAAGDRELRKGPRGGGRSAGEIEEHVRAAEESYAGALGLKGDFLTAVRARARGELPDRGPRGGERWPAPYGIRRAAWHVLDHAWEIEDRSTSQG
jgi:hypothetical protein